MCNEFEYITFANLSFQNKLSDIINKVISINNCGKCFVIKSNLFSLSIIIYEL